MPSSKHLRSLSAIFDFKPQSLTPLSALSLHRIKQGFFRPRVPVDNLEGFTVGVTYFGDMDDLVNPTVVSPDAGGVYR